MGRKPLIGRILVDWGSISRSQLREALAVQRHTGGLIGEILIAHGSTTVATVIAAHRAQYGSREPDRRLGDVLVEDGLVTQEQVDAAVEDQNASGGLLGENLVLAGAISLAELLSALERQYESEPTLYH